MHGLERLPPWNAAESVICVAPTIARLSSTFTSSRRSSLARGLPQRILFPVRSSFFYDHPLGPLVNGVMSFFAMYPPIFRERKRAVLNLASLDELAALLRQGGFYVGIHPEGMRKKDDDPYTLLPAQSGVGRVIRKSRARVLPVFVHGLGNDLTRQVAGGLAGRGAPIHVVFGAAVEMGTLLDAPESPRTYRLIAERCAEEITKLGQEEKGIRLAAGGAQGNGR